jgi:O-antigen ligase/polysaccharide polymerase Wzy-like membrane protein
MEPKQAVFLTCLGIGIPTLAFLLHVSPALRRLRLWLLVFSAVWIIDINIGFQPYRGTSSGFELGTPELITGALLLSLILEGRRLTLAPVAAWPLLALGAWCSLSPLYAAKPEYALWELLRFARAYCVFLLSVNLVRTRADVLTYLHAIVSLILLQGAVSGLQILQGIYRVHGTYAHSNPLGITMVLLGPTALSLFFVGSRNRLVRGLAFAGATLVVVYTRSRASLALAGLGIAAVTCGLLARGLLYGRPRLLRNVILASSLGILLSLPIAAKVADGVLARFREAPESSGESREVANQAARDMLSDHPLGVGLNNYVHYLGRGYGEEIEEGDRTIVHHLYWLMGAETGYPGLLLTFAACASFLWLGAAGACARDDWFASVALGLGVGLGCCLLQHLLEWALRKPQVLFQTAVLAGVLLRVRILGRRPAPGELQLPATCRISSSRSESAAPSSPSGVPQRIATSHAEANSLILEKP